MMLREREVGEEEVEWSGVKRKGGGGDGCKIKCTLKQIAN